MISLIAVLKAKPGQTDALRQALQALLLPTRQEPGNLDYALFQLRDAPDTFYSLLAEPLRLDYLTAIEP
ncbi:MAG: antibiotic biosynthesis monooxygenase [Klebsiella sp.]|nr:antibiotic biosynthesis monooxygenase [Klebsiella sp.]